MTLKAVIVDRDGTLNVEKHYVHRIEDFEFLPGVPAALRRLVDRDIQIHIVTNQAGIARGLYTTADFDRLTQHMLDTLRTFGVRIAGVRYCPHHPEASLPEYRRDCDCRKPATRMLAEALTAAGVDADAAAMIGDRNSDIEAGRRLGLATYLVRTGYGAEESRSTRADHVVDDFPAAVDHLLSLLPPLKPALG